VTSAEILATAAIDEGQFAQAFPSFGPERRGAPVIAFARIDTRQIRDRTAIRRPDVVMVLDPTIMKIVDVTTGLGEDGVLVVNTTKDLEAITEITGHRGKLAIVDATAIAMKEIGRAITNMVLLGSLVRATEVVAPEKVEAIIEDRFGPMLGKRNIKAFRTALTETVVR
jgi:pyruvate ferredoxin oxidoreductase gamma subunit